MLLVDWDYPRGPRWAVGAGKVQYVSRSDFFTFVLICSLETCVG